MATLTTAQIPGYQYLTPAQQASVKGAIAAGQSAAVINSYVQQTLQQINYTQVSSLDPTVAKQYGITGTQVQTTNPSAPNYISPQTLAIAQQQTQKIQQTNQAQASFTLPQAGSTSQTVTSPNGTQYISVPADPVTGAAAQWYQMGPNQTYTPVGQDLKPTTTANGPVAPVTQAQLNQQQTTATNDIAQYQQQQYAASIPHTTVTNIDPTTGQTYTTQYQSADPTLPGYAKASDIQLAQQQAQANQTAYQANQAQAQQQAQAVAAAQQQAQTTAAQQQATIQAQLAAGQNYTTQEQQSQQAAQAASQAQQAQMAQQVAAAQAAAPGIEAAQQAAIQAQLAAGQNYTTQEQQSVADMQAQMAASAAQNAQNVANMQAAKTATADQQQAAIQAQLAANQAYTTAEAAPSNNALQAVLNSGVNPVAAQFGKTDLGNYITGGTFGSSATGNDSLGGFDGLFTGLDKAVGQIIPGGWGTLATIAGGMIAGPLGATIANATAGAVKGETPGQILQNAALTFATAYGVQALSDALSPVVSEAQTGIENGTITPSTEEVPPVEVTTAPDGSTTITTSSGTSTNVAADGTVSAEPTGPVSPTEATTPVSEGPQLPNGPQAPSNITSTGVSDMPAGSTFEGPNGTEVVLDSGKTVNLADYQAAQASGQPISIDGQMTTGVTVQLNPSEVQPVAPGSISAPTAELPPSETITNTVTNPDGTVTETMADGSTTTSNADTGAIISQTPATGSISPGTIAAGGAVVAGGAIAAGGGAGGGATTTTAPSTTSGPVAPSTTPTTTTPTTTTPTTTTPTTTTGTTGGTGTTPTGTTPTGTTGTGTTGTGTTPIDTTAGPINPSPTPTTTTTPNGVTVHDYSQPYTMPDGTPVNTSGWSAGDIAQALAAGYLVSSVVGYEPPSAPNYSQQFFPIPTYNGAGLVNQGVNPGFIQPNQFYGQQQPGVDQYYWGQHGYAQNMSDLAHYNTGAVNAPATPYGNPNAVNLGRLITPQQLGFPNEFTQAATQGTANPAYNPGAYLARDAYNNTVQMNTHAPVVPGNPSVFGPNTFNNMAVGQGMGQQYGQSLNYAFTPTPLAMTGTNNGTTPAGQLSSVSPEQVAAQTLAAANALAPQ